MTKLRKISIAVLTITLVILTKDVLINVLHYINPYSPTNRKLGWFVILPLTVAGFGLSIKALYLLPPTIKDKIRSVDFYIIAPFLAYICYFFAMLTYALILI